MDFSVAWQYLRPAAILNMPQEPHHEGGVLQRLAGLRAMAVLRGVSTAVFFTPLGMYESYCIHGCEMLMLGLLLHESSLYTWHGLKFQHGLLRRHRNSSKCNGCHRQRRSKLAA
jgi:hypothetical protein